MKNLTALLVLAIMLCLGSNNLQAQTVNQGAWMAGGSLGFSTWKYKDADASYSWLKFGPNVGYYVIDDLGVGLNMDFVRYSYDGELLDADSYLSPFVRYYITDGFFGEVSLGLELDEGGGTLFSIAAGYSWFLNNSVAIEPQLFFDIYGNEGDEDDYNEFGLLINFQIFLNRE